MTSPRALLERFEPRLDAALDQLRALVEHESSSRDKPGIDALAELLAAEFTRAGAESTVLPDPERGNLLRAVWRSGRAGAPVLLLGHLDTVWPRGTLAARPFEVRGGNAYGPGVFDMKSGIVVCRLLCEAMRDRAIDPLADVVFFFTSDEEIGTAAGLPHLRREAAGCRAVLCLEPSLPGGRVKTFRKGVGGFRVRVEGVAAHAGVDHEKGANAIAELSRQVLLLQAMTDYARGVTVNVGTMTGGSASNVVPAAAEAQVDVRVSTLEDAERLEREVRALEPFHRRCALRIEGGLNRPPLERTPAVVGLYERARAVASELGMELGEGSTGGGSDGSFTAAMGIPTLDGLGVEGDGAHAVHETIVVADIPRRAALLGGLLERI
jgi:glutamate carboxypeptidase